MIAIFIAAQAFGWIGGGPSTSGGGNKPPVAAGCQLAAVPPGPGREPREGRRRHRVSSGTAAPRCIDELFAVYPDGRVVGDDGTQKVEATVTPEAVTALVANLESLGWFTDDMFSTSHKPCGQCFTYFTTVTSGDRAKTVQAVDGGTDAPAKYWLATSRISAILPKFGAAPVTRRMTHACQAAARAAGARLRRRPGGLWLRRHAPGRRRRRRPRSPAGVWSAVATKVEEVVGRPARRPVHPERHGRLERDGASTTADRSSWSAATATRRPCGTAFVGTGGTSLPPGLHHARLHGRDEGGTGDPAALASTARAAPRPPDRSSPSPTRTRPATSTTTAPPATDGHAPGRPRRAGHGPRPIPGPWPSDVVVAQGGRADRGHQQEHPDADAPPTGRRTPSSSPGTPRTRPSTPSTSISASRRSSARTASSTVATRARISPTPPSRPPTGSAEWKTSVTVPADVTGLYVLPSVESKQQKNFSSHAIDITDK